MSIKWRLFLAGILLGLWPASASAAPPVGYYADDARTACRIDAARLCSHVIPRRGRVLRCLRRNEHALNNVCYQAVQTLKTIRVCRVDYHRLCAHVRPGNGRIIDCLDRNSPKLNPTCYRQFHKTFGPY